MIQAPKQANKQQIRADIDRKLEELLPLVSTELGLIKLIYNLHHKYPGYQLFEGYANQTVLDSVLHFFAGAKSSDHITRKHNLREIANNIANKETQPSSPEQKNEIDIGNRTMLVFNRFQGKAVKANDQKYPILTGQMDFAHLTSPVVNAGCARGREAILIDPSSSSLDDIYDVFINELPELQKRKQRPLTIRHILNLLSSYTRAFFTKSFESSQHLYEVVYQPLDHTNTPMVNLEEFIRVSRGSCRHSCSLAGCIAGKLIRDEYLPNCEAYCYREKTKEGAHQVLVIKQPDCLWFLDVSLPFAVKITHDLKQMEARDIFAYQVFESMHGKAFIDEAIQRYKPKQRPVQN